MKILFADPDRDMLLSFRKIFEMNDYEVTTAFEGAQVLGYVVENKYDVLVLNSNVPHLQAMKIIQLVRKDGIPVVILNDHRTEATELMHEETASAYIKFPFFPSELLELVEDVIYKSRNGTSFDLYDVTVNEKEFCFEGTDVRLTRDEINLLKVLAESPLKNTKGMNTFVNVLNNKFRLLHKNVRIKYILQKGYVAVNEI